MTKIDLTVHPERLERTVQRVRERNIIIPTFAQMKNPALVPASIQEQLEHIGLWDVAPRNLFRITWKNQPAAQRRKVWAGQLYRVAHQPDRHRGAGDCPGRQSGSPPAHTKWARRLAAWCRAW